ncbi:hypothetical protein [Streptosporangium sp. KLBMP 9127]|nr:hypothetical protein [Streptosporangium sp. KLBMP 9127]
MDKLAAQEALDAADSLNARMRDGATKQWHVAAIFGLGLVMLVMTMTYGLMATQSGPSPAFVILLVPLLFLIIFTAMQSVVPRGNRILYSIITPLGGAAYSVVVVVGRVVFPGELWWWLPGAFLCALPFFLVGYLNLKVRNSRKSKP